MHTAKKERLRKAGWKIGSVQDFLGLSDDEIALVELRLLFARSVKQRRLANGWTQQDLAKHLGSSQSRVAKMETADISISIDLFIRALLKLGTTRRSLGQIIGRKTATTAA